MGRNKGYNPPEIEYKNYRLWKRVDGKYVEHLKSRRGVQYDFMVNGKSYNTVRDVAASHNVPTNIVYHRMKSNAWPDWEKKIREA